MPIANTVNKCCKNFIKGVTSRAVCVDGTLGAELLLVLASLHLSAFTFLGFLEADCLGVCLAGGLQCLYGGRIIITRFLG